MDKESGSVCNVARSYPIEVNIPNEVSRMLVGNRVGIDFLRFLLDEHPKQPELTTAQTPSEPIDSTVRVTLSI